MRCLISLAIILPLAAAARAQPDATKDDVAPLVKQLKDPDTFVRMKAAKLLGNMGIRAGGAIPALGESLKDDDEDVRAVAGQALAKINAALAESDQNKALASLTRGLKEIKGHDEAARKRAVAGLAKLLKNPDGIIRAKAAQGLGDGGIASKEVMADLEAAAKDPDKAVREESRKALEQIEVAIAEEDARLRREKLAPLLKKLKNGAPKVRLSAIEEIARLGADGADASEPLIISTWDKAPAIRIKALDALEKVNPTLHKPVVTLLVDGDVGAKQKAIRTLQELGGEARAAVPLLIRFYQTATQPQEQYYCGTATLKALKEIAPDDPGVGRTLLGAIVFDPRAGDQGGRNIDDQIREVSISLVSELIRDGNMEAKQAVKPLLSATNSGCRLQAIKALGELGAEAKAAVPTLTRLKLDPSTSTRDASAEALRKIQE